MYSTDANQSLNSTERESNPRNIMADQLNMNGLSLNDQHGGRSAYIPPHMRGMPPPSMEGPPPPMNGHMNGNAWGGGPTKYGQNLLPTGIAY